MNYHTFRNKLKGSLIFRRRDLSVIWPDFDSRRLSEWQEQGYIRKLRRGYWLLTEEDSLSEKILYYLANRLYQPSYVSFESALSYYNIIPEGVFTITSATARKTNKFNTPVGSFTYRHLKPNLIIGYELVTDRYNFKLAEAEKSMLDFFYLNPKLKDAEDFEAMRMNPEVLKQVINAETIIKMLPLFDNKRLTKTVGTFLRHYDIA